jgi:predicted acetyltransferase
MDLRLRPMRVTDEQGLRAAHAAMPDWEFLLGYDPEEPWDVFVGRRNANRLGQQLPPGWVPETFLVADVKNVIVGRVSIRHELSEFLRNYGGHIGYGVLPDFQRRGYATEILRQALIIARSLGIVRVLVTCDDDNVGSICTIEKHGGVFDSFAMAPNETVRTRRYWIE